MKSLNLNPQDWPNYMKGLSAIEEIFQVSTRTAWKWKNSWLSPAISQQGKTIVVNTAKAIELFNAR